MPEFRYSRWDGTQTPITEDTSVGEIVDALSREILDGRDADEALQRLIRNGVPGSLRGMRSLLERLRRARMRERERGRFDGWLEEMRGELDAIVAAERAALDQLVDDPMAGMKHSYLDSLPESVAGRINELKSYEWASPAAREAFARLLDRLRRQMLAAYGEQMVDGLRSMSPEEIARLKQMLGELNQMLAERHAGTGPTQERFDRFMSEFGDLFPENPRTLDELMAALARRAVAMSRLMAALSPAQRAELQALSDEILGDLDLAFEVSQLTDALRAMLPDMGWDAPASLDGDEPLGLRESLEAIERMSDYEQLENALKGEHPGASLEDVDVERLRRTLGDDAARDVQRLKEIERALQRAGVLTRRGGRVELTPRGIRTIGQRALAKVYERLAIDRPGGHDARDGGTTGEPTGSTRPWRWGDPFHIDTRRTIHNAVVRNGATRGRVRLHPDDFEIVESETRTTVATVLLLDMSYSMALRDTWVPAKRMALALHALISSKYPEDHLSIVGFADVAREMKAAELLDAGWEYVYGTNMEHAFSIAGRLLSKHPRATKQVLLVTDGEPTAHLLPNGMPFFQYPPVRETLEKTYKEAMRLARAGATMNIFMLEDSPALFNFVDRLARVINGRVFAVNAKDLGDVVVRDYLTRRP